jgi:nicotinamide-nucleotide amidase
MLPSDNELEKVAMRLGRALLVRGWRAATAESCTGGWVAKAITDVPGSSQWFDGGVVVYSNAAKLRALGVPHELLETHGAVSEPAVRAMADAVRAHAGVEVAVAVSGVAGPGGGTPDKPVGTVWFAWSGPQGTSAERRDLGGDRETIRRFAVARALQGLLALVWADEAASAELKSGSGADSAGER